MSERRVLLVDDDQAVLQMLAESLLAAGYRVLKARSGEAGLSLARQYAPDIALIDVRLPGISGVDLARQLREEAQVPFLFLSAYADFTIVKAASDVGALGYLVKPQDVPSVVPAIEAALARAAEIRHLRESELHLSRALETGREVSMVVGILMERHHLDKKNAFDALRNHARAQRRKMSDVAREMLNALETVNKLGAPSTAGK